MARRPEGIEPHRALTSPVGSANVAPMGRAELTTTRRMRRIDNGEPLFLWDPPENYGACAYAVSTAVCNNPLCDCARMWLAVHRVERFDQDRVHIGEAAIGASVSSDGTDLRMDGDNMGTLTRTTIAWVNDRLREETHREWLHERWRRCRGQTGDPAYPPAAAPQRTDAMVFFDEVFPYDFDLTVGHEQKLYLAVDCYCLEPTCTCDELVVQFIDAHKDGQPIGKVKASVRRLEVPNVEGSHLVEQLWRNLLEPGHRRLRDRFERMRRVARARPSSPPKVRALKVGTNAPCPCGSGKKYKRCCGP